MSDASTDNVRVCHTLCNVVNTIVQMVCEYPAVIRVFVYLSASLQDNQSAYRLLAPQVLNYAMETARIVVCADESLHGLVGLRKAKTIYNHSRHIRSVTDT